MIAATVADITQKFPLPHSVVDLLIIIDVSFLICFDYLCLLFIINDKNEEIYEILLANFLDDCN